MCTHQSKYMYQHYQKFQICVPWFNLHNLPMLWKGSHNLNDLHITLKCNFILLYTDLQPPIKTYVLLISAFVHWVSPTNLPCFCVGGHHLHALHMTLIYIFIVFYSNYFIFLGVFPYICVVKYTHGGHGTSHTFSVGY